LETFAGASATRSCCKTTASRLSDCSPDRRENRDVQLTDGADMRRSLAPTIVLAGIGLLAGGVYRYFVDDPGEATLANYLRSGLHGMTVALSGWAVHLYSTSRSSAWVTKWLSSQSFQHDADFLFRRILPAGLAPNVL
jgi:hypothetical protein